MAVDLALTHPEMARRWRRLVELCWARGAEVWISSSTRSRATQEDLYRRWRAGTYRVPSVANPNSDGGVSPWGWRVRGSYHMPQADGYSHALDVGHRGIDDWAFDHLAISCGLVRTVPNEFWHRQWFSARHGVFAAPAVPDLPAPPPRRKHRMFMWICKQNDGVEVPYLWDGAKVVSLSQLGHVAWDLGVAGVPVVQTHLNEHDHNLLMHRLLNNPDPGTGLIGSWDPATA